MRSPDRLLLLVLLLSLTLLPLPAAAQVTRTVCASGCDFSSLQSAIDAAQPGDTLLLRAGETFTGNFTLPDKGTSTQVITLRSDAQDSQLPGAGQRIEPSFASLLPKIRSGNSSAALTAAAHAHHYQLQFLELQGNDHGFGEILALGSSGTDQATLADVPHDLTVDRLYVHGDPFLGQKRCIALNSANTTIVNSYVSDCKGVGQDAQAIAGFNGPGPYVIENNYLEGSGENVLFGGADPAIPNLIPTGITFRHNHVFKPVSWRSPILATPQGAAASGAATGGSLAGGTYAYRVQALAANAYQGATLQSNAAAEVSATVPAGSTGSVTVTWQPVANATQYRVYGRTPGSPSAYFTVSGTSFTDTGAAGTASGAPGAGTVWSVKNIFELKNARDVTVYGNVFENCWLNAQVGYPIVFTPRNQDGSCTWCTISNVQFTYNLVRHAPGVYNILGTDNVHPSGRVDSIVIKNTLAYDINSSWGAGTQDWALIQDGPQAVTLDHNTVDHPMNSQVALAGSPQIGTLTITNNLLQRGDYGGVFGGSEGTGALSTYAAAYTFRRNTVAGASSSVYPADNFFPTVSAWQAEFESYATQDFRLNSTSTYKGQGTDGLDLGVDYDGLQSAIAGVVEGAGQVQLPSPWQQADIGAVDLAGNATFSNGVFSVTAGGTDIWDTADAFHYVYQPLSGDGEIVVDVSGLTLPTGAAFSLAGVMIREKLTADSVHATMMITTQGKAKFRRRTTEGGITDSDGPSTGSTYPPRWLKLTRFGNDFSAYISSDGVTWTQVFTTQTIPMAANVYIGFIALRNGAGTPATTATIGNVSVRDLPSPWQGTDIGSVDLPGSASSSGGTFTVNAGGTDIWDTADAFYYVYQPLAGDGTIVANLTGLTLPSGAAFSLAGVMIREKLTADSIHATMMITTQGKAKFRRRATEGGITDSDGPSTGSTYPPRWLKLTRAGNNFSAYISSDGTTWTQIFTTQTISMASNAYVGFLVLRNGAGTPQATGTLTQVAVTP